MYKFNIDRYLVKFKAYLCVYSNLQQLIYQDNYTTMLVAYIFQALIAITTTFNLKAQQFNTINTFINSKLNKIVYYKFLEGFKQEGYYLLLLCTLYRLCYLPLLQLKEFLGILTKLSLNIVEEETCLFTNNQLIVFFFIDDIVTLCYTEDLLRLYQFRDALIDYYKLRDLGQLSQFLGI